MTSRDILVVGFAVTGRAVAGWYADEGASVHAIDDVDPLSERAGEMREAASAAGADLLLRPDEVVLSKLARAADRIVLSPGVPPTHRIFRLASPERIVSEVQLGYELAADAGLPVVAVTGTNGKTTVVTLVAAMLGDSGVRALPAGNIGRPLVELASRGGSEGLEVVVLEVSSFQLAWTTTFRPAVSSWLNFAPDHLDWHRDLHDYAAAKARIWRNQGPDDVAVWNDEDPVVREAALAVRARRLAVGLGLGSGHFRREGELLVTPSGDGIVSIDELPRSLPHDLSNSLQAAAVALSAGGTLDGCALALKRGVPLTHRIELVGESGGVRYYDDSKATTPAAVLAAVCGFESVVLIAGGRNKGLDLRAIPAGLLAEEQSGAGPGLGRLRAVVAIGEAAAEITSAFESRVPVKAASSMDEAVAAAHAVARPGDAVLLSPGCASFDWYRSYQERGKDFVRALQQFVEDGSTEGRTS